MGLSFGEQTGGQSSTATSSGSQSENESKNYSQWQTALQQLLGNTFSSIIGNIKGGAKTPGVQAQQNAEADQINQNYSSLSDRTNRFLASRGFGKSGAQGSSQLKTELARQGSLAQNNANYSGVQDQQNQSFLSDALQAAFNAMGLSKSGSESGTTNASGNFWGIGAKQGFSLPGFGGGGN